MIALLAIGLAAGVLSGLFGIGGGILMVPAMVLLLRLPQHRAQATSLAAIVPIAAVGALVFGAADSVDLPAALVLGIGSVIGVQLGTMAMGRLSDELLARVFGVLLLVVAVAMLLR